MTTALKLGPGDHGRPLTLDEFMGGDYAEGHRYELIDGRLYVCAWPTLAENRVEMWLSDKLKAYTRARPEVLNFLTHKARVFVPELRIGLSPAAFIAK